MQILLDGTMLSDVIGSLVQTRGLNHMKALEMRVIWGLLKRDAPASEAHGFSLLVAGRRMPFINGTHRRIQTQFYSLVCVLKLSVFSYISF